MPYSSCALFFSPSIPYPPSVVLESHRMWLNVVKCYWTFPLLLEFSRCCSIYRHERLVSESSWYHVNFLWTNSQEVKACLHLVALARDGLWKTSVVLCFSFFSWHNEHILDMEITVTSYYKTCAGGWLAVNG